MRIWTGAQFPVMLLSAMAGAAVLPAQPVTRADSQFLAAAVVVVGVDHFSAQCADGSAFTAAEARALTQWVSVHDVARIRERMTQLDTSHTYRNGFATARTGFAQQFASVRGRAACTAAVSLTQRPEAQFAAVATDLLQRLRAPNGETARSGVESARSRGASAAPPVTAPTGRTARSDALVRRIESFGFDTRSGIGVGGFVSLEVYPVVLFRDGTALTDVVGLGHPEGIERHRQSAPTKWTRWRRVGSQIQLQTRAGSWDKLAFPRTYSALPSDFRLDGRFRRLTGTGTVAIGGSQSVTAVSEYTFTRDGRVLRGGHVGATGGSEGTSVVTSAEQPGQRGQYRIDGMTLSMRFDDGSVEERILVADPADPRTAIWLDGAGYVRR